MPKNLKYHSKINYKKNLKLIKLKATKKLLKIYQAVYIAISKILQILKYNKIYNKNIYSNLQNLTFKAISMHQIQ